MTTPDTEPTDAAGAASAPRRSRTTLIVAVVLTLLIAGSVGFSIGRVTAVADPAPASTSAEAGFARDMQVHHDQGVELAMIVRDRTDDEAVRLLAYDIATTQARQSGMMYAWLEVWDVPQAPPEPSMTWMTRPELDGGSHTHGANADDDVAHKPGEPMPGLATPEQIDELRASSGRAAEVLFLTLMIEHHKGAVEMAEAVKARTLDSTVATFADSVIASQTSEIELMTSMLEERQDQE